MKKDILNINDGEVGARRKSKKLTPNGKWQLFLETAFRGAPVGEILRRRGLYSCQLHKIRRQVEAGALKELGKGKYSKKPQTVSYYEHEKLKAELAAKEKALAQMSEEYLLLKKRTD